MGGVRSLCVAERASLPALWVRMGVGVGASQTIYDIQHIIYISTFEPLSNLGVMEMVATW